MFFKQASHSLHQISRERAGEGWAPKCMCLGAPEGLTLGVLRPTPLADEGTKTNGHIGIP